MDSVWNTCLKGSPLFTQTTVHLLRQLQARGLWNLVWNHELLYTELQAQGILSRHEMDEWLKTSGTSRKKRLQNLHPYLEKPSKSVVKSVFIRLYKAFWYSFNVDAARFLRFGLEIICDSCAKKEELIHQDYTTSNMRIWSPVDKHYLSIYHVFFSVRCLSCTDVYTRPDDIWERGGFDCLLYLKKDGSTDIQLD